MYEDVKAVNWAVHPETFMAMSVLASILSELAFLDEAETLEIQVLKSKMITLCEDYPDTLPAKENIAVLYRRNLTYQTPGPFQGRCSPHVKICSESFTLTHLQLEPISHRSSMREGTMKRRSFS